VWLCSVRDGRLSLAEAETAAGRQLAVVETAAGRKLVVAEMEGRRRAESRVRKSRR
jgi:hypothetical protein